MPDVLLSREDVSNLSLLESLAWRERSFPDIALSGSMAGLSLRVISSMPVPNSFIEASMACIEQSIYNRKTVDGNN